MEKKELGARIHDEGTQDSVIWVGLGGKLRGGRRAVVLDLEVGEAVGDGENGRRRLEGHIIGCGHGGLEGRDGDSKTSHHLQKSLNIDALPQTFYPPTARPPSLPLCYQGITLYVLLQSLDPPLTAQHHSHTRPTCTGRDAGLVSRRDRTQQAPHRHRERSCLPPVHVSRSSRS